MIYRKDMYDIMYDIMLKGHNSWSLYKKGMWLI